MRKPSFFFYKPFLIVLFMYLFLAVLGLCCCCVGFSPVVASKGYSIAVAHGLLIAVASCCRSQALGHSDFSSRSRWAQKLWFPGSRAQATQLWRTGLVAPQHVGSSWTRDWTHVSCIGRWILYHWTTREAPLVVFDHRNYRLKYETLVLANYLGSWK